MHLLFTSYSLLLPKLLPSDEAEIERAAVYLAQDLKKSKNNPYAGCTRRQPFSLVLVIHSSVCAGVSCRLRGAFLGLVEHSQSPPDTKPDCQQDAQGICNHTKTQEVLPNIDSPWTFRRWLYRAFLTGNTTSPRLISQGGLRFQQEVLDSHCLSRADVAM